MLCQGMNHFCANKDRGSWGKVATAREKKSNDMNFYNIHK